MTLDEQVGAALEAAADDPPERTRAEQLAALRKPLPDHLILRRPVDVDKHAERQKCRDPKCGGYHAPSAHLDYAGHAAITERLLEVDPEWTWEPVTEPQLLAVLPNPGGGMWIRLTVAGVTRLGYGDAQGKRDHNAVKETIGDALRNAAMRFGVGLDLWHKGDLHVDQEQAAREAAEDARRAALLEQAQTFADTASALDVEQNGAVETLRDLRDEARAAGALNIAVKVGEETGLLAAYIDMRGKAAREYAERHQAAEDEHAAQAAP